MRRRRKRYHPPRQHGGTFGININSLTDMFVLLLVFLLQFQNSSSVDINPEKQMKLPKSLSESMPINTTQVHLGRTGLKVGEKVIANINNNDFAKQDMDPNDSNFITPLFQELSKIIEEEKAKLAKKNAGDTAVSYNQLIIDGNLLFIADVSFTYDSLRKVMYTASMAGFPKLKMATIGN